MVHALPLNQWGVSHLAARLRPGIAISIALHAILLLCLTYVLTLGTTPLQPPDDNTGFFLAPPPEPPPARPKQTVKSGFQPKSIEPLVGIRATVEPLRIAPQESFERTQAVAPQESQPVISDPRPISRGGLVYPERAVEQGRNGYVDFVFTIEPDGSVGDARVVDEMPEGFGFAAAARKAFPRWRFDPKIVNGTAVAAPARIRISFELK